MQPYLHQLTIFVKRLSLVYFIYSLCRLLFLVFNYKYFPNIDLSETLKAFFFGLRFDSFSIGFSNVLFIILSIIPTKLFYHKTYQLILKIIYISFNTLFILFNCVDLIYFSFIKKRSTVDILYQTVGGQTDVIKQIPYYIRDFWYVFIVGGLLIYLFIKSYNKIKIKQPTENYIYTLKNSLVYFFGFIIISGFTVLAMRGGLQRVPIQLVDAGLYTKPQHVAVVLNTPFSIMQTIDKVKIEELSFMENEIAMQLVKPIKDFNHQKFDSLNVVIIILESFSKEYTGLGARKSYTPFLDSLMNHSLVFTNAWSNGTKSIEGIPAIVSSLPNLLDNPYINSSYCDNELSSFASLLKLKGYTSAFFHGGINGTMNFDAYSKTAGYDYYFGKNEYDNDEDFDGNWGIYDEPYFQYFGKKMNSLPEPFITTLFTLSSHHPYKIPKQHQNKFPKGDLEIIESIGYTDYSLKQFFNSIKQSSWYNNTLFIFSADHASISNDGFYSNNVGYHSIPIFFYKPDNSLKNKSNTLMQQIDILPTALDYLGYNEPFFSFGQSVFDTVKSPYAIFFDSGNYYLTNDSMYYTFSNFKTAEAYQFTNDSLLRNNKLNENNFTTPENYLKAYAQLFNYLIINNKTTYLNYKK